MKKVLFCLLLACSFIAEGQVYNNEWIDYSKVYYKFKLQKSGVYRISRSVLATVGLGNIPAEQFQLWRDGVEVPIYTSVASGSLGSSDYIEFWGEKNNGRADRGLYRKPEYHLNDNHSLISDSAVYFLTVNPIGANPRLASTPNETAGNTLERELYFMYTIGNYPVSMINRGYNINIGQRIYSSTYDQGEGWTSGDIGAGGNNTSIYNNLSVYQDGPNPKFKISVSGNSSNERTCLVQINSDTIIKKACSNFDYLTDSSIFPLSRISTGIAEIRISNSAGNMVIHKYELTYPRQYNFGGLKNFEFKLPASSSKRYLEISNFSFGTVAPVLYDLSNGRRYVGDISAKPMVKFVIHPSTEARYVLVNEESSNISNITALQQRFFVNYGDASNQGDFLIISNPLLFAGTNGSNPVDEYRVYRSSVAGGMYNAKVCLVDELIDQFAFGIQKHPIGIRNFILYARKHFASAPKHILLMGAGLTYDIQRSNESNPDYKKLNLVPTFGWPASDVLLAAEPGSSVGKASIGRVSAINAQEVKDYLDKVKEFESIQGMSSPDYKNKLWMKNVVHVIGFNETEYLSWVEGEMSKLNKIISNTSYGAKVTTITKQKGTEVEQINSVVLDNLFIEGISLVTYLGHASSLGFSFYLQDPQNYNNKGKYPLIMGLGCNVGLMYSNNTSRLTERQGFSEKYVLARDKGAIGLIGNTWFGILSVLNNWSKHAYNTISKTDYGKPIGEILNITAAKVAREFNEEQYFTYRCNFEQTSLHGDPSIKLNTHEKPDYVVNDQLVKVSPNFVSISDSSFKTKIDLINIGKAVDQNIVIEVKREFPNQGSQIIYRDTINGLMLADSLSLDIPINPQRDKGLNKLIITIDADNSVDELYESNNSTIKEVFIYQEEARPIYPYNFAIVNDPNVKLFASTADPLSSLRNYKFEIDTTELFNSSLKVDRTISSKGGVLEYQPGVRLKDNTVYYWRVALVPTSGEYHWNGASFLFLENGEGGFNQSHYFQHLKSNVNNIVLDTVSRKWEYGPIPNDLLAKNAIYPTGGSSDADFTVNLNPNVYIASACVGRSLIFNVFDSKTAKPWKNVNEQGQNLYLYGSGSANCKPSTYNNFEFSYMNSTSRKTIMDFMDKIPDGCYVVVRSIDHNNPNSYSATWRSDTALYGSGNSLYHKLQNAGFTSIDSLDRSRAWILIYQKNNASFIPEYAYTQGVYDNVKLSAIINSSGNSGMVESPLFGPAKSWKKFVWESSLDNRNSQTLAKIIGVRTDNTKDTLFNSIDVYKKETDISSINASQYPFVQLYMTTKDTVSYLPNQLKYWRLNYDPVPEGAVAPNLYFHMKDTIEIGDDISFKMAFKNVSKTSFDSLKINMVVIDANNIRHVLPVVKQRPLIENDTLQISYSLASKQFIGKNTLYVEVNPNNDQPEQFHFNNFVYHDFYVNQDYASPILDITFDNVHILNGDIVSSKPSILIKMKDESNKLLLNDSSLLVIKVKYPDDNNTIRTFHHDNDTLRFIPATVGTDNTATIEFNPYFMKDGDYELIVYGEDKSGNIAGSSEYRISFKVINKPMISNMLNYPNPFTSSTAFVFTLTGSEVPQNMKIQILTITGKVVREITKQELGPIRIGRNITEFKWDGTDQYGQKLANGVYLYRVVTSLDGKILDKYRVESDNTDKYFNKGYGKMYLMR